jgi:hypothetical protein
MEKEKALDVLQGLFHLGSAFVVAPPSDRTGAPPGSPQQRIRYLLSSFCTTLLRFISASFASSALLLAAS